MSVFSSVCWLVAALAIGLSTGQDQLEPFTRKPHTSLSFRAPFFLVRGTIPFWSVGGDTVVTDDYVRLTPAERNRNGRMWGSKMVTFENWELEMTARIHGVATGADGMGLWYVDTPPIQTDGGLFGGPNSWRGLAVVMDSFNNKLSYSLPYIRIFGNDNSWQYNHSEDGASQELGSCNCAYRNKKLELRVQYWNKKVQVFYKLDDSEWTFCAAADYELPARGYLGITAATGDLVDTHDVTSLTTNRLVPIFEQEREMMAQRQKDQQESDQAEQQERRKEQENWKSNNEEPNIQNPITGKDVKQSVIEKLNVLNGQQSEDMGVPKQLNLPQNIPAPSQRNTLFQENSQQVNQAQGNANLKAEVENAMLELNILNSQLPQLQEIASSALLSSKRTSNVLSLIIQKQTQLSNAIQTVSSGSDSGVDQEILNIGNGIQELRNVVQSKFSEQDVSQSTAKIAGITNLINELRSRIDGAKSGQQILANHVSQTQKELESTVESASHGYGFWMIFLVVLQFIVGVSYMGWRKMRDDRNKKLF